jgi:hypothetical protein
MSESGIFDSAIFCNSNNSAVPEKVQTMKIKNKDLKRFIDLLPLPYL